MNQAMQPITRATQKVMSFFKPTSQPTSPAKLPFGEITNSPGADDASAPFSPKNLAGSKSPATPRQLYQVPSNTPHDKENSGEISGGRAAGGLLSPGQIREAIARVGEERQECTTPPAAQSPARRPKSPLEDINERMQHTLARLNTAKARLSDGGERESVLTRSPRSPLPARPENPLTSPENAARMEIFAKPPTPAPAGYQATTPTRIRRMASDSAVVGFSSPGPSPGLRRMESNDSFMSPFGARARASGPTQPILKPPVTPRSVKKVDFESPEACEFDRFEPSECLTPLTKGESKALFWEYPAERR